MSAILHNHYGRASLHRYALMLSEAVLVRKYWCGGVVEGIEDLNLDALNHTIGLPGSAEIHWSPERKTNLKCEKHSCRL